MLFPARLSINKHDSQTLLLLILNLNANVWFTLHFEYRNNVQNYKINAVYACNGFQKLHNIKA